MSLSIHGIPVIPGGSATQGSAISVTNLSDPTDIAAAFLDGRTFGGGSVTINYDNDTAQYAPISNFSGQQTISMSNNCRLVFTMNRTQQQGWFPNSIRWWDSNYALTASHALDPGANLGDLSSFYFGIPGEYIYGGGEDTADGVLEQRLKFKRKVDSEHAGYNIYELYYAFLAHRTFPDEPIQYVTGKIISISEYYLSSLLGVETHFIEEYTPDEPEEPEPSEPGGYENPDPDDTSDPVPLPDDPEKGVTSCGFINVYNPGVNALQGLGDILFPNPSAATDVVTAILTLCETFANSNLIDYVIDCHVIPCAPTVGANANIKVGYRNTGISVPRVTKDYVNVSCGSLNIHEYFANFADYLYTKSKLWLPFVGYVDMRPEFWQAGIIYVDYKFNVIDGSFMAYVRSSSSKSQLSQSVIAQFGGNACMHLPLTGVNYSNMVSGLVSAATEASSGGSSAAVLGAAHSAANTIAQGGDVQQSNGYNSTSAFLGVRTPYLLIERPVASYPSKYKHDKGFPSNITVILSQVTGYATISDIDLSGIPLTSTELDELRSILSDGVYF